MLLSLAEQGSAFPDASSTALDHASAQEVRVMLVAKVYKAMSPVISTAAQFQDRLTADMQLLHMPDEARRFAYGTTWLHISSQTTLERLKQHAEQRAKHAAEQ